MAAALQSRSRGQRGSAWFGLTLLALLLTAIWAGHLLAFWLAQFLPFSLMFVLAPYLPVIVPGILALIAAKFAIDFENRRAARAYLRSIASAGSPLVRPGTYSIAPDALILETERIVLAPRWHAIDTVERGKAGWVVSADQLHFLLPYADFASEDEQRRFLAAITERMTGDARARSREAIEFAEASVTGDARASRALASQAKETANDFDHLVASGWLTQEQAGWAASVIYNEVARPGFHRWAYPLTGAVMGILVGMLVVGILAVVVPFDVTLRNPTASLIAGFAIPFAMGAWGLAQALKRLHIVLDKAWRSELIARGTPEQVEARWSLTDTGLAYETARFEGEAAYASIHQLLHEHGYWIAGADALTLCIPDGAFATHADATEFMGALLDRMTDAARERSVKLKPSAS